MDDTSKVPLRWHREISAILRLAIPLGTAQLAQMLMGVTDNVMMGHLGTVSLAAGGLGASVAMLLIIMSQGLLQSLQPIIAQARGAGHPHDFGAVLTAGFVVAGLVMVPIILLLTKIDLFLAWAGEPPEIVALTQQYCAALAWGVPVSLVQAVWRNYLSALGLTRIIMTSAIAACVVNLGLNYVLIFGHLGFPALGLAGSGYSTSLSWLGITITFALYTWRKSLFPQDLFRVSSDALIDALKAVLSLGWPIAGVIAIEISLFSGSSLLVGRFGADALAAHQICINLCSLTFMVPLALGMAATIRVGFHVGAQNPREAQLAGYTAIACGALFMSAMAVAILISAHGIIALYLGEAAANLPGIRMIVVSFLTVAAGFQIFDGIQTVTAGALRGLKDTRPALFVGILGYWLIALPVGTLLAFQAGFGPVGMWWGFLAGLIVVSVLLSLRFKMKTGALIRLDEATAL